MVLDQINIWLYLLTFISLSLWFLNKDNKAIRGVFGKFFLIGLGLYTALFMIFPSSDIGWLQYVSHLAFLFFGGFFLNTFSSNRLIFLPLLFLFSLGYYYSQNDLSLPFSESDIHQDLASPDSELLIELHEGHQLSEIEQLIDQYQLKLKRAFNPLDESITELDDYYLVDIPQDQMPNFNDILELLQQNALIDHVEINEILRLDPNELKTASSSSKQDDIYTNDPDLEKLWGFEKMKVGALYSMLEKQQINPVKRAKIAIIDTGVDAKHEDLSDNYQSIGVRHDKDEQGHGTHCAGIAAAVTNNQKGIASFAPDNRYVSISSVKVFGKYGSTTQQKIIEGMLTAVDNGADVLSMSLGGPATGKAQRAYKQAVKYANKKGAIVVVAAGNENTDAAKRVPASVDGVITVAAIDNQLNKASFSNYVSNVKMGIAAPGVQVFSTMPANKYAYLNGTSMATPYVAGLLGLMKSIKPQLNTEEAYKLLKASGMQTNDVQNTGMFIQPTATLNNLLKN